jgi:hypothetical protein
MGAWKRCLGLGLLLGAWILVGIGNLLMFEVSSIGRGWAGLSRDPAGGSSSCDGGG